MKHPGLQHLELVLFAHLHLKEVVLNMLKNSNIHTLQKNKSSIQLKHFSNVKILFEIKRLSLVLLK